MEIKELTLFSNNIDEQEDFYENLLGFECSRHNSSCLEILTSGNKLIFVQADQEFYYHFAFLIPTGTLESAIGYLEERSIALLRHQGNKIVYFDLGRAIYFYDSSGNIVEFIERPMLDYSSRNQFTIDAIIKLNEIGLPVKEPLKTANRLVDEFFICPLDKSQFNNEFCWVGDHNGVVIVVKEGRNWLPTKKKGVPNDFSMRYTDTGRIQEITFKNNEIL